MEAKRYNRKTDDHDDDRRDALSLRPPSRRSPHDNSTLQSRNERRKKEHNPTEDPPSHARTAPLRPFARSSGKADQEDRKFPGHIHIDDEEEEEEEKQDIVTSRPSQRVIGGEPQQMYPGAVAIQGPGFASSDQSIAGTILVGDQIPNEPSTRENQNLVIAAVVVPNEADEVARIDNEIERRVRDQFDRFLQQTPRAETVNLGISANDDRNEPLEETSAFAEGVEVGSNEMTDVNISNKTQATLYKRNQGKGQGEEGSQGMPARVKFRFAHLEPARKKRFVCLISILAVIIVIVAVITVAVLLSKSSAEDDNELVLQCSAISPCNLDHADANCTNGQCMIDKCELNYDNCNIDANDGCEVNLQTDKDHCGSCNNKCSTGDSCTNGECVNLQRQALMSLYESTNGPNWPTHAQTNWGLNNVNECEWDGVRCVNGKVTYLNKFEDNLKGTIPTDVGLLTELTHLSFHRNELTGTLPSEMASLTKLKELELLENELTGTIPTEMGRLTNMEYMFLHQNIFTGTLPSEMASMTKLIWLNLYANKLTGAIPTEMGRLTNMKDMWLARNQLTGTLPTEMGSLTKLTKLPLDGNGLTGTIPTEMGRLTNMGDMRLFSNQLSGTLLSEMASLTKLTWLSLNYNELVGTIPTEMGGLTNMESILLSRNQLTGTLPSEMASMTKLTTLWVFNNNLASIPTEICNMGISEFLGDCPICAFGCCTNC